MKYKKLLFLFLCLIQTLGIRGQSCALLPLIQGKSMVYEIYDSKGNLIFEQTQTPKKISAGVGLTLAELRAVLKNEKGKEISVSDYRTCCASDTLWIDMQMMVPGETLNAFKDMEVRTESDSLPFPAGVAIGSVLKDAKVVLEFLAGGSRTARVEVQLFDRKVEATERIQVPAGTFEALRISARTRVSTETQMLPVKIEYTTMTWFSPGNGIVKMENIRSNGKQDGYTVLKAIR